MRMCTSRRGGRRSGLDHVPMTGSGDALLRGGILITSCFSLYTRTSPPFNAMTTARTMLTMATSIFSMHTMSSAHVQGVQRKRVAGGCKSKRTRHAPGMYMDHSFLPLMWKQWTLRFMQPTTAVFDTFTIPTTRESNSIFAPDTCNRSQQTCEPQAT